MIQNRDLVICAEARDTGAKVSLSGSKLVYRGSGCQMRSSMLFADAEWFVTEVPYTHLSRRGHVCSCPVAFGCSSKQTKV